MLYPYRLVVFLSLTNAEQESACFSEKKESEFLQHAPFFAQR